MPGVFIECADGNPEFLLKCRQIAKYKCVFASSDSPKKKMPIFSVIRCVCVLCVCVYVCVEREAREAESEARLEGIFQCSWVFPTEGATWLLFV